VILLISLSWRHFKAGIEGGQLQYHQSQWRTPLPAAAAPLRAAFKERTQMLRVNT